MSRIGRMPIAVPAGVTVDIQGNSVRVKGSKGEMSRAFSSDISISLEDNRIIVRRPPSNQYKALHGLTRALLANMVTGVSAGFSRRLQIEGVGYRAEIQGKNLVLNVGYSHPVIVEAPEGIQFEVEKGGRGVIIRGVDKELIGEIAARIRRVRPPEPYKGKGILYDGEIVRHKAGKAGKS